MSDAPMEEATMSENIIVQRQVVMTPGTLDAQTRHQVDVLAASQQLTYAQLKQFWDEHEALRRDTGTALGQASEALQHQHETQEALRATVEYQGKMVAQQQEQLQVASHVVAQHREQLHAASAAFQAQREEVQA